MKDFGEASEDSVTKKNKIIRIKNTHYQVKKNLLTREYLNYILILLILLNKKRCSLIKARIYTDIRLQWESLKNYTSPVDVLESITLIAVID